MKVSPIIDVIFKINISNLLSRKKSFEKCLKYILNNVSAKY